MSKCWTCGTHVSGYRYTCAFCQTLTELQNLQKTAASYSRNTSNYFDYIAQIQQNGFVALNNTLSTETSAIASAIEWGFGEISWQLQQQTDVLRSIDHTLKTPTETKANEWRLHAEELRHRGVLEESEEFFLKALDEYRLDYRIYVGLAETYLQMNKFDEARIFLKKSLPHAPTKEIDYKSYSYRFIGHIYACEGDYEQAISVLQSSIELSPNYKEGHYDYAQYCAQTKKTEACIASLQEAIRSKPLYWYLARKEKNFDPIGTEIEHFLANINIAASHRAKDAIYTAEGALNKCREAISETRGALSLSRDWAAAIGSNTICATAETK
ncbi:MAG: tetratricopeptide repeat protein, partial [Candidatus Electrothrix sp. AR3]|nr:tetratricopeptide repeat protein [Candidatus Electrothrix sp. AR3]